MSNHPGSHQRGCSSSPTAQRGEKLAVKAIDKRKVFETRISFRPDLDERCALELVNGHPFFSRLRYIFQTRVAFYLAIDFYASGDLYQYIRTNSGRLVNQQARIVSAEVVLFLDFVYRDLKPENVLLDENATFVSPTLGLFKLLPASREDAETVLESLFWRVQVPPTLNTGNLEKPWRSSSPYNDTVDIFYASIDNGLFL